MIKVECCSSGCEFLKSSTSQFGYPIGWCNKTYELKLGDNTLVMEYGSLESVETGKVKNITWVEMVAMKECGGLTKQVVIE